MGNDEKSIFDIDEKTMQELQRMTDIKVSKYLKSVKKQNAKRWISDNWLAIFAIIISIIALLKQVCLQ